MAEIMVAKNISGISAKKLITIEGNMLCIGAMVDGKEDLVALLIESDIREGQSVLLVDIEGARAIHERILSVAHQAMENQKCAAVEYLEMDSLGYEVDVPKSLLPICPALPTVSIVNLCMSENGAEWVRQSTETLFELLHEKIQSALNGGAKLTPALSIYIYGMGPVQSKLLCDCFTSGPAAGATFYGFTQCLDQLHGELTAEEAGALLSETQNIIITTLTEGDSDTVTFASERTGIHPVLFSRGSLPPRQFILHNGKRAYRGRVGQ